MQWLCVWGMAQGPVREIKMSKDRFLIWMEIMVFPSGWCLRDLGRPCHLKSEGRRSGHVGNLPSPGLRTGEGRLWNILPSSSSHVSFQFSNIFI